MWECVLLELKRRDWKAAIEFNFKDRFLIDLCDIRFVTVSFSDLVPIEARWISWNLVIAIRVLLVACLQITIARLLLLAARSTFMQCVLGVPASCWNRSVKCSLTALWGTELVGKTQVEKGIRCRGAFIVYWLESEHRSVQNANKPCSHDRLQRCLIWRHHPCPLRGTQIWLVQSKEFIYNCN